MIRRFVFTVIGLGVSLVLVMLFHKRFIDKYGLNIDAKENEPVGI